MVRKKKNRYELWWKAAPIVLALISIFLVIYFNYPSPRIQIDFFQTGGSVTKSIGGYGMIVYNNESQVINYSVPANITQLNGKDYYYYNWTFQAINSGKSAATGVNFTVTGEPSDRCRVLSTTVYVDEPIASNTLAVVQDHYFLGIMEIGKRYILDTRVVVENPNGFEKFFIDVSSSNSPTARQTVLLERS
jgi:hypothetical protein